MKAIEKLQQIDVALTALYISLREIRNDIRFAPPELSRAIGSLQEAERHLKSTIAKMNGK